MIFMFICGRFHKLIIQLHLLKYVEKSVQWMHDLLDIYFYLNFCDNTNELLPHKQIFTSTVKAEDSLKRTESS